MSVHKQKLWNDMCTTVKSSDGYQKLIEDINECAKSGNGSFAVHRAEFIERYCNCDIHAVCAVIRSLGLDVHMGGLAITMSWLGGNLCE